MCNKDTCKMPTPAQAHCSVCHLTFGGVSGFDSHRVKGTCVPPAELGMTEVSRVWRRQDYARKGASTED